MSIARHTAYNVVGSILPIAVSLVTVPLYLRVIGLDLYGVLNLCWLLVGYFGFFDFGLGRATAQHIAKLHDKDDVIRSRAFWAGLHLSAVLAIIAALVSIPVSWFALREIKLGNGALHAQVQGALPFLVAAVPLAIFQSVLRGALEGRREFFLVNAIISVGAIATAVFPLAGATLWGPDIRVLVAISVAIRCMMLLGLGIAAARCMPLRRYERPETKDMRTMTRFGAWLTVTNIVGPLMVFADRFLIGAISGAAAVALYVIPFNVVSQLVLIPSSVSSALFPRFAAAEQPPAVKHEALLAMSCLVTPMSMSALLFAGTFLRFWIGTAAAVHSTPVALALIVGFWANGVAQVPFMGLLAAARTDVTAKVHLAEVGPYFLLLWFGLTYFGLVGAAIAWSIRGTVDLIALALFDQADLKALRTVLLHGCAVMTLATILLASAPGSILCWALVVPLCLATAILLLRHMPDVIVRRVQQFIADASNRGWLAR